MVGNSCHRNWSVNIYLDFTLTFPDWFWMLHYKLLYRMMQFCLCYKWCCYSGNDCSNFDFWTLTSSSIINVIFTANNKFFWLLFCNEIHRLWSCFHQLWRCTFLKSHVLLALILFWSLSENGCAQTLLINVRQSLHVYYQRFNDVFHFSASSWMG